MNFREALFQWLIEHGYSHEEAQRFAAFVVWSYSNQPEPVMFHLGFFHGTSSANGWRMG